MVKRGAELFISVILEYILSERSRLQLDTAKFGRL